MRETDSGYQRLAIRNSVSLKSAAFRWHRPLSSVIKNSLEGSARTRAFDICCGWGIAGSIHEQKFRKGRDEAESERSQPLHPLQRRSKGSLLSGFTSAHSGNRDLSSIKIKQPLASRALLRAIVLASSLFSFSVVASEAPECDPEEIRLYSSNPTEEITDAVVSHLDELARAKNGYEGFPDLACLLNLYAINDADDAPSAVEKAKWLLDRTPTDVIDALLIDASKSGSFIFDTFYKDGMCLFHRLADSVASSQVCAPGLEAINLEIERLQAEQKALIAESSSSEPIEESDSQSVSGNEDEQLVWCVLGIGTLEIFVAQHSREACKERDGLGFNKRQTALQVKEKQEEILAEKRKEEERQKKIREAEEKKKAEAEKKKEAERKKSADGGSEPENTIVSYEPLLIRAKASDERFCYSLWKSRPYNKFDTSPPLYADVNKETGIDFCWDFLTLDGVKWVSQQEGLVISANGRERMKGNFRALLGLAAPFLFTTGDARAMYCVARALRVGRGVRPNEKKAFEYYLKAANKEHYKAQYFAGLMYVAGMGVAKNLTEGVRWIKKAVSAGDGDAKAYLGYLSEFGIGVSKDMGEAKRLYREAARMQHPFAKERLQAIGAG